MEQPVIADWKKEYTEIFSKENLLMEHRLLDSGLFSRDALADLIDRCGPENYSVNTMGHDVTNPLWREGTIKNVNGKEVIETIERGRMWLNLRAVNAVSPAYKKLLDQIFGEFQSNVPGFKSFKHKMGILISSPNVHVHYHADIPGQSLWQLEGKKRVYVYPKAEPYITQQSLETVILKETEEEIPYHKDFDKGATVYELEPGQMLHWPLNKPHRVENHDCLNISVTTEHFTDDIRKTYAVNYANGILRRKFGMQDLSPSITSASVFPKAALALIWSKLRLHKTHEIKRMIDFVVDPAAKTGMTDIPRFTI